MVDTDEQIKTYPILEQKRREQERARGIYATYQERTRQSSTLKYEISKGALEGEGLHSLLLKAVDCIALLTDDQAFGDTIKGRLQEIGIALGEEEAIAAELAAVQGRLVSLRAACREGESYNLKQAIAAHERREAELLNAIKKGAQHGGNTSEDTQGTQVVAC